MTKKIMNLQLERRYLKNFENNVFQVSIKNFLQAILFQKLKRKNVSINIIFYDLEFDFIFI